MIPSFLSLILIHTGSRGGDQRDDAVRRLRDDPLLQLGDSIWKGFVTTFFYPYFPLFGLVTFHHHKLDSSFKQLFFILIIL